MIPETCDICGGKFEKGDLVMKHMRLGAWFHYFHDLETERVFGEIISGHALLAMRYE